MSTTNLERILFVDDEPDIRTVVVSALQSVGGFSVVACNSGHEALERASTANADLLLLDVMMPVLDGVATLRRLREIEQTKTTPVIFMTAKAQADDLRRLKALGALEVIQKPFDPVALPGRIRDIWADAQRPADRLAPAMDFQAIVRSYAEHVPAKMAQIEELWSCARSGQDASALKSLHLALHSIAGSAGTFGLTQLGTDAKALELALAPHLQDPAHAAAILDSLKALLEKMLATAAGVRPRA